MSAPLRGLGARALALRPSTSLAPPAAPPAIGRATALGPLPPAPRAPTPAHSAALSPLDQPQRARHVAVSGIGVAGLMAAYSAINRARDIGLEKLTVLDVRDHHYVLEIGFNFRPEHLRMMAVMSPKAARKLFDACGLVPGNEANVLRVWNRHTGQADIKLSDELYALCRTCEDGALSDADREAILARGKGAPSMAHYAHDVAEEKNVAVVTARELEQIYFDGLGEAAERAGVALDYRPFSTVAVTIGADGQQRYVTQAYLDADGKPTRTPPSPTAQKVSQPLDGLDLLLVAEGAGGAKTGTRAAVGETASRAISPDGQRWMAGVVKGANPHGLNRYAASQQADGTPLRAVRGDHAVNGNQWRLVQLPSDARVDPLPIAEIPAADVTRVRARLAAAGRPTTDLEVEKAHHGERLEQLFRKLTAPVGAVDPDAATYNAFGQKGAPVPFTLAGRAYDRAVIAGGPDNAPSGLPLTVALGDAVLNTTFNVSLGAGTSLIEYVVMDELWDAVAAEAPRREVATALERDLMQAAHTWGVAGISQFDGRPRDLVATYYPKVEMERVFPPEIVARYYTEDGQLRALPSNRFWRHWLANEHLAAPKPAEVEAVMRAARRDRGAGPRELGAV